MIEKLARAFSKLRGEVQALSQRIDLLPEPKDGRDGVSPKAEDIAALVLEQIPTPKDGVSPKAEDIAALVLEQIPTPKDGRNGKDADARAIIEQVLAQIPKPKDGKDAQPPLLADVAEIVMARMPKPKDGKDGKSPTAQEVAAVMPAPKPGPKGQDGKDGVSVTDVKLEKNVLSVWLDGKKKRAGKIDLPQLSQPAAGGGGGLPSNNALIDTAYFPGKDTKKNTVVYDSGWLMSALRQTTQRAAVQPTGEPFFLYDGTPTNDNALAKQVIVGQRYTFERGGYATAYSLYTVTGNRYEVFLVNAPEGVAEFTQILTFTADTTGDQRFGLTARVVPPGTVFDIVVIIREPDPTPTTFSADYNYQTPNNDRDPNPGEIVHADKTLGIMRVSKVDTGGAPVAVDTLASGDQITRNGVSWSIQSASDQGDYMAFAVAPSLQSQPDGVQEVVFETVTPTPITYQRDDGHWAGEPNIRGLFIVDGPYSDIVPDDNAYGIVDLEVQEAEVPTDWYFLAFSGDAAGSSVRNVRLEELGTFATSATQSPTGLGDAGKIRVNFGAGGSTSGGEFTVAADGLITCNKNSIQYDFDVAFRIARNGGAGESEVLGRIMYAPDGVEVNAIQVGDTFAVKIDDDDTVWREQFEIRFSPAVGSVLWFEVARNPGSSNSGQLETIQPAGDLAGWNPSNTASLTIGTLVTF